MLTIDASVWISAASPTETDCLASRAFLDQVISNRTAIIVPTFLRVEVAAAISRVRKDVAAALEFSESLVLLPNIRWAALDSDLAHRAVVLAADHALRGADATYAAVALWHHCTLISLDRGHLTRLVGVLQVKTPLEMLSIP